MRVPKHIGIIPDGNRRWALEHNMEKKTGINMACVRGLNCCEKQKNMGRHEKALRFSAHTVGIFGFLCEGELLAGLQRGGLSGSSGMVSATGCYFGRIKKGYPSVL